MNILEFIIVLIAMILAFIIFVVWVVAKYNLLEKEYGGKEKNGSNKSKEKINSENSNKNR